jgi:hypothetical protein
MMISALQQIGKSVQTTQNWVGKSALALLWVLLAGCFAVVGVAWILLKLVTLFGSSPAKENEDVVETYFDHNTRSVLDPKYDQNLTGYE